MKEREQMASNTTGSNKSQIGATKKVAAIKHQDKRSNIPTEELRDFVTDDEKNPKTLRYPRDTSLDPQLVWKGKDEQDSKDLMCPVVPIYIQEKIHPQVLIEDLLGAPEVETQFDLFSDFNGGPKDFEQKIDFYHHEQNWTNRMILGDSLLVMNSLSEKEGLRGKIQTIFLDPPYGIKFGSNWQVSTRKKDVKDNKADDATRQPEQIRAFRDTWELGIHSYLSYLRDRLTIGRELLNTSGSIFIQIGDENVHLVRSILDEVFGSENFISMITFRKTSPLGAKGLVGISDYILWYAKDKENIKQRNLYQFKKAGDGSLYTYAEDETRSRRRMTTEERSNIPDNLRAYRSSPLISAGYTESCFYDFEFEGKLHKKQKYSWKTNKAGMERLIWANRIMVSGETPSYVRFHDDFPVQPINNLWADTGGASDLVYVVQTSNRVIERCILMSTDPGDIVLDPTCGSGTSAVVAEQWGRRWITCDTSRVALALARTRLMSTKFPYYLLADSVEGRNRESEIIGKRLPTEDVAENVRKGFIYKRVPHITLKSIANNPEIQPGMSQKDINSAIARSAEFELLVDQPYEINSRVRVCGPFSVESLSPHRVLSNSDTDFDGSVSEKEAKEQQDFVSMILENLKRSGIQNTHKGERLKFVQMEPFPGRWIVASGTYLEADGKTRRVAISIGPEHGTVGPEQLKEAAKEAVQGVGFDVLAVCGFAFDPYVSEEAKRFGKLTVLPTKMNPDLSMGDDLLKKTGAGNLFMVFGEPDVNLVKDKEGGLTVELNGVDIYDPTTGQVRSSSTDEIACWFIDTEYNGESFFVRHAYFTGADKPMEKLSKALRSDINEDAWQSIYGTVSRSFKVPSTKKIAVKVINHYGDEVLKVFDII
jgi:adenine-specific DNA-methyltransferase